MTTHWGSCPELSQDTVFAFVAAVHIVAFGGGMLVAGGRILTTVAVVAPINVEPMRPAVIGIGVSFLRGIGGGG